MTIEHFERIWLDYPEFGHVGFVAARKGGEQAPSRMAPRPDDFVMLR
jgi:hypothetical protein